MQSLVVAVEKADLHFYGHTINLLEYEKTSGATALVQVNSLAAH